MASDVSLHDVVDFLNNSSDEEFAEVFARYQVLRNSSDNLKSEEMIFGAEEMEIDTEDLADHIKTCLDEIIYSEEIDRGAWWKSA